MIFASRERALYYVDNPMSLVNHPADAMIHYIVSSNITAPPGDIFVSFLGLVSFAYQVFRSFTEGISRLSISWKVYFIPLFDFWKLTKLTSLILLFGNYILVLRYYINRKEPNQVFFDMTAANVGFLWLNALGLIKVLNKQTATFILALHKILKHIVLFTIVCVVLILGFGDMLYISLATNKNACPDNFEDPNQDENSLYNLLIDRLEDPKPFCHGIRQSYIGVYRVFIGDFSKEDFGETWLSTTLYILITFFGIIILLNVLIALVMESYEKSKVGADQLFGKARLYYVAELTGLEVMLHPLSVRYGCSAIWIIVKCAFLLLLIMALGILVTWGHVFVQDLIVRKGFQRGAASVIGVLLMAPAVGIFITLLSYCITGWRTGGSLFKTRKIKWLNYLQNNPVFKYCIKVPIMSITRIILGTRSDNAKEAKRITVKVYQRLDSGFSKIRDTISGPKQTNTFEDRVIEKIDVIQMSQLELEEREMRASRERQADLELSRSLDSGTSAIRRKTLSESKQPIPFEDRVIEKIDGIQMSQLEFEEREMKSSRERQADLELLRTEMKTMVKDEVATIKDEIKMMEARMMEALRSGR